jgi:hypothetical protein
VFRDLSKPMGALTPQRRDRLFARFRHMQAREWGACEGRRTMMHTLGVRETPTQTAASPRGRG